MGTYVLALWLAEPREFSVGRLGEFRFPAGWYLYAGSALGPGGLQARLARHWRRFASGKRPHWHIDYLREQATWGGAWGCGSGQRIECVWAMALRELPGARIVAPGFGASDCRCPSHLVQVMALPSEDWFASVLGASKIPVQDDELKELLETLSSGSEGSREAAALALGRYGAQAAEPLAAILAEGDSDARWWAARALAEVGRAGGLLPLLSALSDPDPDVRACVALALGRIRDGSAALALAERLTDESAFVSSIAADALSMIGAPAVDVLAGKLAEEDSHARLLSVRALSRIKSPRAIGPLFDALEDPSYLVRYYAQEALEALGVGMVYLSP